LASTAAVNIAAEGVARRDIAGELVPKKLGPLKSISITLIPQGSSGQA
jgi:hypothetical protein